MKNVNRKHVIIALTMLMAGVLLGKFIFQNNQHEKQQTDKVSQVWTCSMHPQIRQDEPGKCPICGMDLIPLQRNDEPAASPFIHAMTPEAVALANIQTAVVGHNTAESEVSLTGRVLVNEQNIAVIAADFSGRIEQLHVNFTGQEVKKGQVIAGIYSPELLTAQRELLEAKKNKDLNPLLYQAAKDKLRLWKLSEHQISKIEQTGAPITTINLISQKSGIVLNRYVAVGDYVSKGAVLMDIADLSKVWVVFDAYESDLAAVAIGQKIAFSVAAFPGKEFNATVSFIEPAINPQTRTLAIRAEAENPRQELKPEMFAKGTLKSSGVKRENVLTIPRTAVLWTGKRSIVYVKVNGLDYPAFEMREVTLGSRMGEQYVIENGLVAGEEVVVNGAFSIDAAAQINGNYSMMNKPKDARLAAPAKFKEQLTGLIKEYFEVKNALVNDDFKLAQNHAKKMQESLKNIDMSLLDKPAHDLWMPIQDELSIQLRDFVAAKNIEIQRMHFEMISMNAITISENFGLTLDKVYKAFCPMAFDDKGAYWLSESAVIRNPYFGASMLKCGSVTDVIEKDKPVYQKAPTKTPQPDAHQH
jgi:membrane fusion protein, copper/silver efflux system